MSVRTSGPWYRTARKMWFANVGGLQRPLGIIDPNDRAGANVAYANLLEQLAGAVVSHLAQGQPRAATTTGGHPGRCVAEAIAGFLAMCERKAASAKLKEKTVEGYRKDMENLAAAFAMRPIVSMTAEEIEQWADRPSWSPSTQNSVLGTVQMLFKWAAVPLSPPIRRPPKESRGADTILTEEQFDQVLGALSFGRRFSADIGELLQALRETGARPSELAGLRIEEVDWSNCCTRRREHKTRRHTGTDRIIHFNSSAMKLLEKQRNKHKEGLLFRTRHGNAYTANIIRTRLGVVSKRVGFRVIAYGLGRHSFATRALEAGIPNVIVAGLLGHKGTAMLERHYSHVADNSRLLKAAAEKIARKE